MPGKSFPMAHPSETILGHFIAVLVCLEKLKMDFPTNRVTHNPN